MFFIHFLIAEKNFEKLNLFLQLQLSNYIQVILLKVDYKQNVLQSKGGNKNIFCLLTKYTRFLYFSKLEDQINHMVR
jgi:hypothetical protein